MSEERPSNITNLNTKQIGNDKFNGLYSTVLQAQTNIL